MQVAQSIGVTLSLAAMARSIVPSRVTVGDVLRDLRDSVPLLVVFAAHSLHSLLLAEAERLAMWLAAASASAQGAFAVASNLGSLLARVALLPLEQIARRAFERLAASESRE